MAAKDFPQKVFGLHGGCAVILDMWAKRMRLDNAGRFGSSYGAPYGWPKTTGVS